MGRKIPGKKHRSIKDPYVQRKQRFASIKNKVNNPPPKGKEDEQAIPKSVLRIMQLKEKAKQLQEKSEKKKQRKSWMTDEDVDKGKGRFDVMTSIGKDCKLKGMKRPDRYMPDLTQKPNEGLPGLAARLHNTAMGMMKELRFENKFGVEMKRNDAGEVIEVKQLRRERRSKKSKLSEKRKAREEKKMAGKEIDLDFAERENFEFGDIVHAPPENLTLPARRGKEAVGRKPGKSDLLLKKKLTGKTEVSKKKTLTKKTEVSKKVTDVEKERRERLRQAAVDAFRQVKKNRRAS